jgi:hypothetical protein
MCGATCAPWIGLPEDLRNVVALPLQTLQMEAVVVKVMVLVLIAVALLAFAAGSSLTPPPVTSSRLASSVVTTSHSGGEGVDAYGNEITNAVAEYSLDPAGALYERHAPQIELPHLGSPKS